MENDYRITKFHGTLIGDNRIPDLPVGETAKILSSTNGKTEWVDLPEGGKSVSPCLNLMNMEDLTVRTFITEEEKTNLENGLYNSVFYADLSLGPVADNSAFFPEPLVQIEDRYIFSFYTFSFDETTQKISIDGTTTKNIQVGEKNADGTYRLIISDEFNEAIPFGSGGGASVSPCLNLIDLSSENPTIRTSITEEEKTNWDKQLYNSILYFDPALGNVAALSAQFPENLSPILQSFSTFNVSQNVDSSFSIKSVSSYTMQIGEKSADGTYPIGIEKSLEAYFGDRDGVGIIKAPDAGVLTSEDGYNILSNSNELVYAGWSNINGTGDALMLGLCPGINKTATGEQEYCSFVSIVVSHGIGELSLKKDSNNVPRVKSFTTWLPPVTDNSEGKALIVTGGNAQWTTTPRYEHTVTLKTSAGKILWTQTMRNSSNTVVNSYANLKTLFGGATYAGFGEYCQLNLRGGTESTDKLIKADGTEATLESLGAIVYTDVCFLPK